MFLKNRQHLIKILSYTTRSFWLLLIPLTRSLVALRFDVARWLEGWWIDVIVISLIFIYAFSRWLFVTFDVTETEIVASTGFFGIVKTSVGYDKISSVSFSQGGFYRLVGAYNVFIDTTSGTQYKSDIKLTMNKKAAERLKLLTSDNDSRSSFSYSPKKANLLIFSILFSHTLSGVVLFLTFIVQSSRIVGRNLEKELFDTLNLYAEFFSVSLPQHVLIIAAVIALGWLCSFVLNIMRHWSFNVSRSGLVLRIKSGIVARRFHVISIEKINFIDIKQSLLMKIFHICSVHIHCAGYGKSRREIAVLIPITTLDEVEKSISLLLPESFSPPITLICGKRNAMRFLWPPIWLCVLIPVCTGIAATVFSSWAELIRLFGVIAEIPALWLVSVKTASIFTTGIGVKNGYAKISYCRFYKFHTLIIPTRKITKLSLYSTPFQRMSDGVSFKIFAAGEGNVSHKIKNFRRIEAERFCTLHGFAPKNL